jgi:hypothetical protein
MAVFAFYVVFQMLAQLLGLAYTTKVSVLSTLFGWLSSSNSAFIQKFVSVASEDDLEETVLLTPDDRERRAAGFPSNRQLLNLVTGVYRAINKHED